MADKIATDFISKIKAKSKDAVKWFKKIDGPQLVIWNVENDDQPTFKESFYRLEHLKNNGPTDYAYAWKR